MYDLVGKTFGTLLVKERTHKDNKGNWHYRCLCLCGKESIVRVDHLISGNATRCRYCRTKLAVEAKKIKPNPLKGKEQTHIPDLSGQIFNDLTVLERSGKTKSGERRYRCVCLCGKETFVSSTDLRSGSVKRCKLCGVRHMINTKRENAKKIDRKSLYPVEFSSELKRSIRRRDNYTCQLCGNRPPKIAGFGLHVHHIDGDKHNNDELNLVGLCNKCHPKMLRDVDYWIIYWQEYMKGKYVND